MNTIYKYAIFTLIAIAMIWAVVGADAILNKAETIQQDVAINEKVEISQAAIEQATKLGYKDVSEGIKAYGVNGLEERALVEEIAKLENNCRRVYSMKDLDTTIQVNQYFASVLTQKEMTAK